ncbi:MAG TPA: penicillin acylase family protein [Myxococcota bacterium]|nr:penicillin acylase family protein [Myxococcota bacterium]
MRAWGNRSRAAWQRIALGLLVAFVLGAAAAWGLRDLRSAQQRRAAFPEHDGRIALAGLKHPVAVRRDAHGVPHIEAQDESDGWFALGFVHAQDRLAQMLWLRQVANGRAAASVGRRALPSDRLTRTLDFAGLARRDLRKLPARARRVLEAFAAGADARLAQIRDGGERAPVDVARLALPLDPWEPADSLAILKLQAWSRDASVDASLVLSDLIQRLGDPGAARFFPGSAITDEVAPSDAQAWVPGPYTPWDLDAALRREAGYAGRGLGSSAWVLGGGRSASGHPILAGDLHLEPTVPGAFHLDHLRAGDLELAGATLPGVPLFWCGHNRRVAWFPVSVPAVVVDLYVETLDPDDPTRYHDGDGWRPLDRREERIEVRGGASELLDVRSTRNGPLLPDLQGNPPLSVRWSGAQGAGSGFAALLEGAYTGDADAFRESLREHREPMLAVAYADVGGAAGVKIAGYVPRRSLAAKLVPLPGRARYYQWRERVPFEALPSLRLQDPQGWVIAADAPLQVRGGEPIEWLWQSGARAARIDALLEQASAGGSVGLRQMADLQADVGAERAPRIIAKAIALVEGRTLGTQAAEVARLLENWDGRATRESDGAAAYYVFLGELLEAMLEEHMGSDLLRRYLALPQTDPEQLALDLLDAAHAEPQVARRARVADAVDKSLRGSWLALSYRLGANARRWAWGDLHPLRFRALGAAPGRNDPEGLGPFSYGGSSATVSAAPYDFAAPFAVTTASTLRLVIDLGAPGQALAAIAPGQSEHPGHAHREDGLRHWLEGRAWLFATDPLLVEDGSVARLDLEPVR